MNTGKWRYFKRVTLAAAVFFAVFSIDVASKPQVRRPVGRFMHYYAQSSGMHVWERVVYSWIRTTSS